MRILYPATRKRNPAPALTARNYGARPSTSREDQTWHVVHNRREPPYAGCMTDQELIDIIRSDSRVGRGSCTTIDECYDAADLVKAFGQHRTKRDLLRAVYAREGLAIDRMLDQRFGDDSDVELKIAAEWRNSLGETRNEAKARRARARRTARKLAAWVIK